MINPNEAIIGNDWDEIFLAQQAQFTYPYAIFTNEEGERIVRFEARDYENVMNAIENYPVSYLPTVQANAKARIVELGKAKVEEFSFGGMTMKLDYTTEARITSAVVYLDRNTDVLEVNWDIGAGNFVTLPRENVLALGDAVGDHVQKVFNKRKELTDAVNAATDINDPIFAAIEEEWFPETPTT